VPESLMTVNYEDVVTDLEGQVAKLLNHCGLPFEEACVQFHENDRAVRSASSEQVRQPIFTGGLEQWRNFEQHLDSLKEVLTGRMVNID
jgi:hypothetical protein